MGSIPRYAVALITVLFACEAVSARVVRHHPAEPAAPSLPTDMELTFTKGDTRLGARVSIRIVGDTLHYSRTQYVPGQDAIVTSRSVRMTARRQQAMKRVLGKLPRFQVFGSCFGEGMRYYMIDTPQGKFYRSLPEASNQCFTDEPDIWPFIYDLDNFIAPPEDEEDLDELSALPHPADRS